MGQTIPRTIVHDVEMSPKVTLTRTANIGFACIVEVEGLDPKRTVTAEEKAAGITSLNPPTVVIGPRDKRKDTHRALLDAIWRAVSASATSTLGETGGPGEIAMCCYRVTRAVRHALRLIDEPI